MIEIKNEDGETIGVRGVLSSFRIRPERNSEESKNWRLSFVMRWCDQDRNYGMPFKGYDEAMAAVKQLQGEVEALPNITELSAPDMEKIILAWLAVDPSRKAQAMQMLPAIQEALNA